MNDEKGNCQVTAVTTTTTTTTTTITGTPEDVQKVLGSGGGKVAEVLGSGGGKLAED